MADISKIQLPSGTTYNIKDASSIHAPSSPSSGDALTYNGSAWVASANAGGVFVMHIDNGGPTENYNDILAAYRAGKAFICIDEDNGDSAGAYPVIKMEEYVTGHLRFTYRIATMIQDELEAVTDIQIMEWVYSHTTDAQSPWGGSGTETIVPVNGASYVFELDDGLPTEDKETTNEIISRHGPMFAFDPTTSTFLPCISYQRASLQTTLTFADLSGVYDDSLYIGMYTYTVDSNDEWTVEDTGFGIGADVIYQPLEEPSVGDVLTYSGDGEWVGVAPGVNVYIGTTAPSGATTGTLWLDTSDDESLSTSVSSVEELAGGA